MWFNNRFKNNKIQFVPSEWTCTDPDEFQYCRVINDHEFEYIQLKNKDFRNECESLEPRMILGYLDERTTINDWYQAEIDVNDYDADELGEYVAPYGGILDGVDNEQDRNQLMAECIFETDLISGDYD